MGNRQWGIGNREEGEKDLSEPTLSAHLPRPPLADRGEGQEAHCAGDGERWHPEARGMIGQMCTVRP